jgi:hypothetical protein
MLDDSYVDEMGLSAVVVRAGKPKATAEAVVLLRLGTKQRAKDLMKMFGLHAEPSAANPIARALRAGCAVSDRMVITDGAGETRLVEVTTLPTASSTGSMLILIREHKPEPRSPRPIKVAASVTGRRRSRGLAPAARDIVARAGRR